MPGEDSDQTAGNVKADLNLCLARMSEGTFSDVASHIKLNMKELVVNYEGN